MKSAQDCRAKAAEIERLACDPSQPPEIRAELRAIGVDVLNWYARTSISWKRNASFP